MDVIIAVSVYRLLNGSCTIFFCERDPTTQIISWSDLQLKFMLVAHLLMVDKFNDLFETLYNFSDFF